MNAFFWIMAALLVGLGGYTGYANWKTYLEAKKMREHMLSTNQDAKSVQIGTVRVWAYAAMAACCVALGVIIMIIDTGNPENDSARYAQGVIYFGLAVFAFAMFGEALTDSEMVAAPDAFLYGNEVIRYKNIRSVTATKGWFKSSMIVLSGAKEVAVSRKTALWVEEQWETWKKERKQSFKSRKERRLEARRKREEQ